jgi:hypothetical protein
LEKRNKELSTSPMDSFVKKEDMPTWFDDIHFGENESGENGD